MVSWGGWSIDSLKLWPTSWLWRFVCWPVSRKLFCGRMFEVSKLMEELAPTSEWELEVWFPQSVEIFSLMMVLFNEISGHTWSMRCPFSAQCKECLSFFLSNGEIEWWVVWCSWVAAIELPHQENTTTTNNVTENSLVIIKRERLYKTNLELYMYL